MNHRAGSFSLIIAIISVLPAYAAPAEPRPRAVLAEVAVLEKRVTYTETKIPLGELIAKVASDTGAPLTAAKDVADEPVAVVVKDLAARELLEQLAELLDYQWSRRPASDQRPAPPVNGERSSLVVGRSSPRYEIWQDLASKQREEALRKGLAADVERRFQEDLHRYTEMASLPEDELRKIWEGKTTAPKGVDALEAGRRRMIAKEFSSSINRAIAALLGRLTPAQWDRIRETGVLVFSTEPRAGELSLPAEMARVLRSAKPTLYPPAARVTYPNNPDGAEQTRRTDANLQANWASAAAYRVRVQIDPYAWRNRSVLALKARAMPYRGGAPPSTNFFDAYSGTSVRITAEPLDFWSWQRDASVPPEQLAKDPVFGAREMFRSDAKPRRASDEGEPGSGRVRLHDLLPDLAHTYHVAILADAYTSLSVGLAPPPSSTEPVALFTLLKRFADQSHRWDRRGSVLRLRSRTWFLDRPREIPLRLTRRWQELQDQRGALPLATYVEMATTLSALQIENLPDAARERGILDGVPLWDVVCARSALLLYASLSAAQRQSLEQGAALPEAGMLSAQRALFLASLRDLCRSDILLELQNWSDGRLSLTAEPYVMTVERRGETVRRSLRRAGQPAAPAPPPAEPATVTQFPVTRLKLHFYYAAEDDATVTLVVAAPG